MSVANTDKHAAPGERTLSSSESSEAEKKHGAETASAETQASAVTGSWDPYQVWLTRVKQPRELQQAHKRRQERVVAESTDSPDISDTARLRALTAGLPR